MRSAGLSRLASRYPVTMLLAVQYGVFAVWPAWHHHNPSFHFIWWITAVALLAAAAVETACSAPRRSTDGPVTAPVSVRAGIGLCVCGIGSHLVQTAADGIHFGGHAQISTVSTLMTPMRTWALIGCACLLLSWRAGHLSRRRLWVVLAAVETVQFWYAVLVIGRSAPFMAFTLALATGCLLTGAIRPAVAAVGLVAVVVLWPTIVTMRNETRAATGADADFANYNAGGRLREDLLLQGADQLPAGVTLSHPSLLSTIRYGLLPRVVDRGRDPLHTSNDLSVAYGGVDTSSYTLTMIGTCRAFTGTGGMMMLVAGTAGLVRFLRSRETPLRLAMVMVVVQAAVWIESTYPDAVAAVLQAAVSMSVALLVIRALERRGGEPAGERAKRGTRSPVQRHATVRSGPAASSNDSISTSRRTCWVGSTQRTAAS